MSKLKRIISENVTAGAVGAGAIAGARGSLFGGGMVTRVINPTSLTKPRKKKKNGDKKMPKTLIDMMREKTEFDSADVISKLKSAEKTADQDERDTASFGLEDEDGQTIRVSVERSQADEFSAALEKALHDSDKEIEVAEVLHNLRNDFDIVDVQWPEVQEDEEEESLDLDGEGELEDGMEGDGEEGDLEDDSELDGSEEGMDDTEEAATSALQDVINMLKADAEAKQAEAEAKKAEAEATSAKFAAQSAESRIKSQEEVMDMEDHYDSQAADEKEAKEIAKVAKYRHSKAQNSENSMAMEGKKSKKRNKNAEEDKAESFLSYLTTMQQAQ